MGRHGSNLLCYVDSAEQLTSETVANAFFLLISTELSEGRRLSIFLDVDGPVLLALLEVDGTINWIFPQEHNFY